MRFREVGRRRSVLLMQGTHTHLPIAESPIPTTVLLHLKLVLSILDTFAHPLMHIVMAHELQQVWVLSAEFNKEHLERHREVVLVVFHVFYLESHIVKASLQAVLKRLHHVLERDLLLRLLKLYAPQKSMLLHLPDQRLLGVEKIPL